MTQKDEALKKAIEQIKWADHLHDWHDGLYEALEACKEALSATPAQEPVGKVYNGNAYWAGVAPENDTPLYTSPQKRQWVNLSDDEVQDVFNLGHTTFREFAKAIEAKLKEVNHG